jgi:hypothetical protein
MVVFLKIQKNQKRPFLHLKKSDRKFKKMVLPKKIGIYIKTFKPESNEIVHLT